MNGRQRLALASCLFFAACSSNSSPDTQEPEPTFTNVQSQVLVQSCALSTSCHRGSTAVGGLQLDGDAPTVRGRLVGQISPVNGESFVVPGDADKSYFYRKLTGKLSDLACASHPDPNGMATTSCGEPMPYRTSALPDAKLRLVHDWIAAGAPND